MRTKISDWVAQYKCLDWAVLYMRIFAGGIMLFHNVGKIQSYNEIIDSYPAVLYIDPAAVFTAVSVIEVLLASLIIVGLWVRMSALILSVGIFLSLIWQGFGVGEITFVWLGIYVFLVISGSGIYAFDRFSTSERQENGK